MPCLAPVEAYRIVVRNLLVGHACRTMCSLFSCYAQTMGERWVVVKRREAARFP